MKTEKKLLVLVAVMMGVLSFVMTQSCNAQITRTVDTLNDDGSEGSLRTVLEYAGPLDTIEFEVTGTIYLNPDIGTLYVDQDVNIVGPGAESLTIDAQLQGFPVFMIGAGFTLTEASI